MADRAAASLNGLDEFEGKFTELFRSMRGHMGDLNSEFATSLKEANRKFDENKSETGKLIESLRAEQRRTSEDHKREADALQARLQLLERELQRVSGELAQQQGSAYQASESPSILAKMDVLAETIEAHRWDAQSQYKEVETLRTEVNALPAALEELRSIFDKDASRRQLEEEAVAGQLREHEKQLRDSRLRESTIHETLRTLGSLRDALSQDKERFEQAFEQCRAEASGARRQSEALAQELAPLRSRLGEADEVLPKLRDLQRAVDKLSTEQALSRTVVDNRIAEVSLERAAREEELEKALATSRAQMQALLTKQAENSRLASETLLTDFQSQLEKEMASREAQAVHLEQKVMGQRLQLEDRVDAVQRAVSTVERQQKEGRSPSHEELVRQIRDLREAFITNLANEKAEREVSIKELQGKVGNIGFLFAEVGQKFTQSSRRPSPELTPRGTRALTPTQQRAMPQNDQRRPFAFGASANGGSAVLVRPGTLSPTAAAGGREPVSRRSSETRYPASDGTPRTPPKTPPELTEAQQRSLRHVLGHQRVELLLEGRRGSKAASSHDPAGAADHAAAAGADRLRVLEEQVRVLEDRVRGLGTAELRLKEPLEFRPASRLEPAAACFEQEDLAMGILQDVAEVLKVYRTATVLIEGHAEVPLERMDRWSTEVAMGRAELVKSTISRFGVEPQRLETRGLPEHTSNPGQTVTIKIPSF